MITPACVSVFSQAHELIESSSTSSPTTDAGAQHAAGGPTRLDMSTLVRPCSLFAPFTSSFP